ncbi:MAG: hypothetical protein U9R02_14715 [Thermodesulfobacteriota bacterium]|nr:hypothetical protein [Thermodesulfobacteriota bacterium]
MVLVHRKASEFYLFCPPCLVECGAYFYWVNRKDNYLFSLRSLCLEQICRRQIKLAVDTYKFSKDGPTYYNKKYQ